MGRSPGYDGDRRLGIAARTGRFLSPFFNDILPHFGFWHTFQGFANLNDFFLQNILIYNSLPTYCISRRTNAYSDDSAHPFQRKRATHSDEGAHRFRRFGPGDEQRLDNSVFTVIGSPWSTVDVIVSLCRTSASLPSLSATMCYDRITCPEYRATLESDPSVEAGG